MTGAQHPPAAAAIRRQNPPEYRQGHQDAANDGARGDQLPEAVALAWLDQCLGESQMDAAAYWLGYADHLAANPTATTTGAPVTTPTVTYTDPTGAPYGPDHTARLEQYAQDLMSGRVFRLHAASARSARGYRPPMHRDDWSHAMATIARMAHQSDALAQVASKILGRVNLYGTRALADAQIWERAAEALEDGFDDVIGRAGPEAGRFKDHQHPYTLHQRLSVLAWVTEATAKLQDSVPGLGWCASALIRAHQVRTHTIGGMFAVKAR